MRYLSVVALALLTACSSRDAPEASSADATVAELPAPSPDSIAQNDQITHGPPVCQRRPGSTLITARGIGPAQLGESVDSLNKLCTVRDSALRADEGQPSNGKAISVGEGLAPVLLFIDESKPTIRQTSTADPFFRTTGGVGVGSTVADLRQNHTRRLCGDLGPTGIEVWSKSLPGVVFGTTAYPPRMPKGGSGLKRDASAVPDSSQITTISVSTAKRECLQ